MEDNPNAFYLVLLQKLQDACRHPWLVTGSMPVTPPPSPSQPATSLEGCARHVCAKGFRLLKFVRRVSSTTVISSSVVLYSPETMSALEVGKAKCLECSRISTRCFMLACNHIFCASCLAHQARTAVPPPVHHFAASCIAAGFHGALYLSRTTHIA